MFKILGTLLGKPKDGEGEKEKRVGLAASVLMNLMNQKMSACATKMGVSLVAQGTYPSHTINAFIKVCSQLVCRIIKQRGRCHGINGVHLYSYITEK